MLRCVELLYEYLAEGRQVLVYMRANQLYAWLAVCGSHICLRDVVVICSIWWLCSHRSMTVVQMYIIGERLPSEYCVLVVL